MIGNVTVIVADAPGSRFVAENPISPQGNCCPAGGVGIAGTAFAVTPLSEPAFVATVTLPQPVGTVAEVAHESVAVSYVIDTWPSAGTLGALVASGVAVPVANDDPPPPPDPTRTAARAVAAAAAGTGEEVAPTAATAEAETACSTAAAGASAVATVATRARAAPRVVCRRSAFPARCHHLRGR